MLQQMVFKEVTERQYFGGRTLIEVNNLKNVKRAIQRSQGLITQKSITKEVLIDLHRRRAYKFSGSTTSDAV